MAYVIAEPCIGTKDTACVDACPADCIHPQKNTTYEDRRPGLEDVPQLYIDVWSASTAGPVCLFALFQQFSRSMTCRKKWKHYAELNASYVEGGKFKPDQYAKGQAAK